MMLMFQINCYLWFIVQLVNHFLRLPKIFSAVVQISLSRIRRDANSDSRNPRIIL
jgi:hypothetical protein